MKYQYQIWQLKENFVRELGFRSYEKVEDNFFKEHYQEVYRGDLEANFQNVVNGRIYCVLDALFEKFNVHRPTDFTGHSLSVSDVVVVNGMAFYCDKFGWVEVDFEEVSMDKIYADEELVEIEKQYDKAYKEEA